MCNIQDYLKYHEKISKLRYQGKTYVEHIAAKYLGTMPNSTSISTFPDFWRVSEHNAKLREGYAAQIDTNKQISAIREEYDRRHWWIQCRSTNERRFKWCKLYLRQTIRFASLGAFGNKTLPVFKEKASTEEDCICIENAVYNDMSILGMKLTKADEGYTEIAHVFIPNRKDPTAPGMCHIHLGFPPDHPGYCLNIF